MRRFRLPLQNGQLAPPECILEKEFGFGTREVLKAAHHQRRWVRAYRASKNSVETEKTKQGRSRLERKESEQGKGSRWAGAQAKCRIVSKVDRN